ncbi:hypothetical protein HHI36_018576 [Cryptolaemus montrouzieri]|uniref:Uncharacterized protein n=1 Tax=Cryptolaemus montrouzieri TaxID=559131 RepID=A0ABD2P0C5_9CUCU
MNDFDKLIEESSNISDDIVEAQPLWEYPCVALSEVADILTIDFSENPMGVLESKGEFKLESNHPCNGIALWIEWEHLETGSNNIITTGPTVPPILGEKIAWDMNSRQGLISSHIDELLQMYPKEQKNSNLIKGKKTAFRLQKLEGRKQMKTLLRAQLKRTIENHLETEHIRQITNGPNKIKAIWNIINSNVKEHQGIRKKHYMSADALNPHFAIIATQYSPYGLTPSSTSSESVTFARRSARSTIKYMIKDVKAVLFYINGVHRLAEVIRSEYVWECEQTQLDDEESVFERTGSN